MIGTSSRPIAGVRRSEQGAAFFIDKIRTNWARIHTHTHTHTCLFCCTIESVLSITPRFANHKCVAPDHAQASVAKAKAKFADAAEITTFIEPTASPKKDESNSFATKFLSENGSL